MASFGAKVRDLRQGRGMTQGELAATLNLASHSHISHLEQDVRYPSLTLVHQVACVFGVTTEYLLRDALELEAVQRWEQPDTDTAMHRFGLKVRALRKQHHLTQRELATQLGLKTHTHISELEKRVKDPSRDLVLAIADVFNCSTDVLIRDGVPIPD